MASLSHQTALDSLRGQKSSVTAEPSGRAATRDNFLVQLEIWRGLYSLYIAIAEPESALPGGPSERSELAFELAYGELDRLLETIPTTPLGLHELSRLLCHEVFEGDNDLLSVGVETMRAAVSNLVPLQMPPES